MQETKFGFLNNKETHNQSFLYMFLETRFQSKMEF